MQLAPQQFPRPRSKRRIGCLGSLVVFCVVGPLIYLTIQAAFAPWAFYLGGNFHALPMWQGWGRLHAKSGDFPVWIYMYPSSGSRLGYPNVTGTATVCTPHGERFQLKLYGIFLNKHIGLHADGQPISIHLHRRPASLGSNVDGRPRLEFRGTWHDPNLVMDDQGSLASAFHPDGRAYLGAERNQPPLGEKLPITFSAGSRGDFDAACKAAVH
jgi:hypothetical protein